MIDWSRRTYTEAQFIQAWESAQSYRDVLRSLSMSTSGGSMRIIKETAKKLGLRDVFYSYSGQISYTLEEILVKDSPYKNTSSLRARLIKEGILDPHCSAPFCPFKSVACVDPFTGTPSDLPIALDHIDGDPTNNEISNLRILCQHCHSLTDTWCGRNKIRKTVTGETPKTRATCACGSMLGISNTSGKCVPCANKLKASDNEKIVWPDPQKLADMVEASNFVQVGRTLGVSDNAVRKRLRKFGLL